MKSICSVAVLICVLLIGIPCSTAEESDRSRRPNVLFIAVDDLRPSIGCYGDLHAITPNLDRLAKKGVRFTRAYCQVAVCNPSRASLMTGQRPDQLGVWTLPIHFREAQPDAVTLPQWFRRFGYTAVSHGKIFHNPTPDPQSWSEPIRPLPALKSYYPPKTAEHIRAVQKALPPNDWRKNNLRGPSTAAPEVEDDQLMDGARTRMAIEDLKRLGKTGQPFFLAMGYIRPHLPWVAPKKYWDLHDSAKLPVMTDGRVIPNSPPYALSNSYELTHYVDLIDFPKPWEDKRVEEKLARRLMHAYYASVSYVDAQIGLLLDALEKEGLTDNTIVVLWSDHGWKLGEFNGWGKMTNYEIDTRVPLMIAAPGLKTAGQSSEELAELLDLFPTLCELADIDIPKFVQGTSLLPNLMDVSVKVNRAAFSQYYRNWEGKEYMGYAMRTDSYRFVEWRDFQTGEPTALELYDHRKDHAETANIAKTASPELLDRLKTQLLESHPRHGLRMIPAVHSNPNPGRWPANISFKNNTKTNLFIYPITPQGRRGRRFQLPPDQQVTIKARIGGVFVVESQDGSIHQIHSPSLPARTVDFH